MTEVPDSPQRHSPQHRGAPPETARALDRYGGPARLLALSDGVFAIAMTLLVLDITVPPGLDPAAFRDALRDLPPKLGAYALSFAIIAAFWRDHNRHLRHLRAVDGVLMHVTLLGLGLIALLPFPTTLLSEYGGRPQSVAFYAAAVAAMDGTQIALLVVRLRRPWLNAVPLDPRAVRADIADAAATAVVFTASIPLTYAIGPQAIWSWVLLLPLKFFTGRRQRAAGTG
ncbi:TMEM175 family protein [Yinghuangia soli]|uniref:DUF1211 domain-containing protein n=1 Tax=Yinghuangia soli TaxID=2908204 RepID=A0AA41Q909_9ACTN|nr:TMEM175 family protein [Yinghuangia soli]MCF2532422.1 DUF1211 domain-containing protein [Yinghuangia soli]